MEELVKRARELGIDVEDLIITAISRRDPSNGLRLRLELARRYLNEPRTTLGGMTQFRRLRRHTRPLRRLLRHWLRCITYLSTRRR